jgi:hypothetical protein
MFLFLDFFLYICIVERQGDNELSRQASDSVSLYAFNIILEKFNRYKRRERVKTLKLKQKVQILSARAYLKCTKESDASLDKWGLW